MRAIAGSLTGAWLIALALARTDDCKDNDNCDAKDDEQALLQRTHQTILQHQPGQTCSSPPPTINGYNCRHCCPDQCDQVGHPECYVGGGGGGTTNPATPSTPGDQECSSPPPTINGYNCRHCCPDQCDQVGHPECYVGGGGGDTTPGFPGAPEGFPGGFPGGFPDGVPGVPGGFPDGLP